MKILANVRTWHIESAIVATVMTIVALMTGNHFREWIGAAAVWVSFMHAQVTDRLAEDQALRPFASVDCWSWAGRYFITKEILWLSYFVMSQTWSALVGVLLFLVYPLWRKFYRKHKS